MASVDPVFHKVMQAIKDQALHNAQSLAGHVPANPEVMCTPASAGGSVPALEINAVHKYFDRTELYRAYVDTVNNKGGKGPVAAAIAAKLQADILAQCERDYITQHGMTRVRARMHAASRRQAHASATGPVGAGIEYEVQNYLKLA